MISDVPGFKKLVYTLPFDGSGECDNASLTVHEDRPDVRAHFVFIGK